MLKNQPEAIFILHMKMILNIDFRKHEMGSRKATLQRKVLSYIPQILSHHGFFHHNLE